MQPVRPRLGIQPGLRRELLSAVQSLVGAGMRGPKLRVLREAASEAGARKALEANAPKPRTPLLRNSPCEPEIPLPGYGTHPWNHWQWFRLPPPLLPPKPPLARPDGASRPKQRC